MAERGCGCHAASLRDGRRCTGRGGRHLCIRCAGRGLLGCVRLGLLRARTSGRRNGLGRGLRSLLPGSWRQAQRRSRGRRWQRTGSCCCSSCSSRCLGQGSRHSSLRAFSRLSPDSRKQSLQGHSCPLGASLGSNGVQQSSDVQVVQHCGRRWGTWSRFSREGGACLGRRSCCTRYSCCSCSCDVSGSVRRCESSGRLLDARRNGRLCKLRLAG